MTDPMVTMECAAILFDLDGVLIDSTNCVVRHWRNWAEQHSLDPAGILRIAHGVRNVETMRLVAPYLDVEKEAAVFAANEVADTDGVMAVNGARELIASLSGASWTIVTSCSTALAHARLMTAKLPAPPLLISGDDVLHGKPAPDPYLLAAGRLGIAVENCVVVEDAPAGVQAGKKAGMRVVGIASTYSREDLEASGTEVVIAELAGMNIRRADGGHRLVLQIK